MNRAQVVEQLPGLRRYARMLTGDAWAADDLVQDTLSAPAASGCCGAMTATCALGCSR